MTPGRALWFLLLVVALLLALAFLGGRHVQAAADDRALWVLDSLNAQAPTITPAAWLEPVNAERIL